MPWASKRGKRPAYGIAARSPPVSADRIGHSCLMFWDIGNPLIPDKIALLSGKLDASTLLFHRAHKCYTNGDILKVSKTSFWT
jgi:hypothetical protein